jgi:hypothetical protein
MKKSESGSRRQGLPGGANAALSGSNVPTCSGFYFALFDGRIRPIPNKELSVCFASQCRLVWVAPVRILCPAVPMPNLAVQRVSLVESNFVQCVLVEYLGAKARCAKCTHRNFHFSNTCSQQ